MADEELHEDYSEVTQIDETKLRQRNGKLGYLKSQMEKNPTEKNVFALVDEIRGRNEIDRIFHKAFSAQFRKELQGEALVTRPKDFACMRTVHNYLNTECDDVLSNEYALNYNRYVVDFCETTE